MQSNKLRMAIRSTAAVAMLGVAAQASAIELDTGGYQTNVYGFARIAASYDIDENIAAGGQSGNFSGITTGNGDTADGHFGMDANTSRLGVSVVSPQDVKAVVEFDFDRDDSLTPRLRLAYGEYKGVLIGQNWSNFNSFIGTYGLDFDGLPGLAGVQSRTTQVRYTSGPLSVSLEEPFNSVGNGVTAGAPVTDDTINSSPAFTARLEDSQGGLSYSAAVLAKQTAYDTGGNDDSIVGYAAFLAGSIALTDMITINATLNYGDGATGYIYRAGGNFSQYDGYTDNGDIESVEAYGGSLGANFDLGGGRSITAGYGTASVDLDDAVADSGLSPTTTDTNTMMFVTYQWMPVEKVTMGVEYAYLETETQGGDDGDANRLMFLAQYNF